MSRATVIFCLVVMDAVFAPLLRALISEPSDLAFRVFCLVLVGMVLINSVFIFLAMRTHE